MSLQTRLSALITAIGADIKLVKVLRGTTLPLVPFDGQLFDLVVDANGGLHRFRYNSSSLSAYKWESVGGASLYDHVGDIGSAAQSTSNTSAYVDLTTVGPSVTLPYEGDYLVEWGFHGRNAVQHGQCRACPVATGLAALAANAAWTEQLTTGDFLRTSRIRRFDAIGAAAGTLKLQYSAVSGQADFIARDLKVTPIRIRNNLV